MIDRDNIVTYSNPSEECVKHDPGSQDAFGLLVGLVVAIYWGGAAFNLVVAILPFPLPMLAWAVAIVAGTAGLICLLLRPFLTVAATACLIAAVSFLF